MGEPANQKIPTTPTMWNPASYHSAGEQHEVADPLEWRENLYQYPASSAGFIPLQGYHASHSEQSTVPGDTDISAYDQAPPSHFFPGQESSGNYLDFSTQEIPGASDSGNTMHHFPLDSHIYASGTQVPYDVSVTDPAYDTTIDYSTYQHNQFVQPPPTLHTDLPVPGDEGGDPFGYFHSLPNPQADQHHIEGQSFSATPEHNHNPYGSVPDYDGTLQPCSAPVDDVESKPLKKRKRTATQEKMQGVKRARLRTSQQMSPPAALHTRHDLRMVEQVLYEPWVAQKGWIPLDPITFNVKNVEGIKLTDAMNLRFDGPEGRDELMFTGDRVGNSVSCRIEFVGYSASSRARQIVTNNHKRKQSRITKKKLAREVAKSIETYLKELKKNKTPFTVAFEDMVLTRIVNVSSASWQPEIWCQDIPSSSS